MVGYTQEDKINIVEEVSTLQNLFLAYHDYIMDNNFDGAHHPPALSFYVRDVINDLRDDNLLVIDEETAKNIYSLCSTFFSFAQYAARNGCLTINFVQCNCDKVDDNEIKSFLRSE